MTGLFAGGFRIGSLALRMLLSLFLARYLPFADIGVFALLASITGLLPGAAGLGLSFFVNRELVGMEAGLAQRRARDRLLLTAACGATAAVVLAGLLYAGLIALPVDPWMAGAIIVLEMIGFDLHLILISRGRAGFANLLLFVRSAGWIPVFILWAWADPAARSIDALVLVWLGGMIAFVVLTALGLRRQLGRRALWRQPFDGAWLRATLRRSPPIWISDFGLAMGQYVDRFFITAFGGLEAAGVYYFFFSIANGALVVAQAVTIQLYMPELRAQRLRGVSDAFYRLVRARLVQLVLLTGGIMLAAYAGTRVLLLILNRADLAIGVTMMPVLLLALIAKSMNDFMGIVDYVSDSDRRFVLMNVALFAAICGLDLLLIPPLGLYGAALAILIGAGAFAALRWQRLRAEQARLGGTAT